MSFQNTLTRRDMLTCILFYFRYLLLHFTTSKLYTTSLLSSLNSRQGWGYDTSENNDEEFDLGADLGLRFVSNSQSTAASDRTSVVIATPLVSPLFCFPIMMRYILTIRISFQENELNKNWHEMKEISGADLETTLTPHGQQIIERP